MFRAELSRASMMLLLPLALLSAWQATAQHSFPTMRREAAQSSSDHPTSRLVGHEGSVLPESISHQHHHKAKQMSGIQFEQFVRAQHKAKKHRAHARDRGGQTPLLSGAAVKLRNRGKNNYLTSCASCNGVGPSSTLFSRIGNCPSLVGPTQGCAYTANGCIGGTFQIIKIGFSLGNPIHNGDVVVLKSMPSMDGDSDFYAYVGTCGAAFHGSCPVGTGTSSMVRLFKGNSSNPAALKAMQTEIMWTINKEQGEGEIVLGEHVTINKAETNSDAKGAGTYLSVCGANSTDTVLGQCGARNNVFTRYVGRTSSQDDNFHSQWILEANFSATCTDPADTAVTNLNDGKGNGFNYILDYWQNGDANGETAEGE